jgi:hypothetical protein
MATFKVARLTEKNTIDLPATPVPTPTDAVRAVFGPQAEGDFVVRAPNGAFRFVSVNITPPTYNAIEVTDL